MGRLCSRNSSKGCCCTKRGAVAPALLPSGRAAAGIWRPQNQRLTEASRFRVGAAGSRLRGKAGESLQRAGRCRVQAQGGSAHSSVVRQFPPSLHLSRGAAPQQPFPPAACPEAPAAFLPPAAAGIASAG